MTSGMTLTPRTPEITQNPISKSLLTCNPVRERRPMCPKADVKTKKNARDKERTPTSVLIFYDTVPHSFICSASSVSYFFGRLIPRTPELASTAAAKPPPQRASAFRAQHSASETAAIVVVIVDAHIVLMI